MIRILAILAILAPVVAFGQTITAVSDTVSHGDTITVEGSGFGAGATIITWETFEGHTPGTVLHGESPDTGPTWNSPWTSGAHAPDVTDFKSYNGDNAGRVTWNDGDGNSNWASYFGWTGQGPYSSIYFTYWRYLDGSGGDWEGGSGNHKTVYLFGTTATEHPQFTVGAVSNAAAWQYSTNGGTNWFIPYQTGGDSYLVPNSLLTWSTTKGAWQRWEVFIELNTPYDTANDKIQLFHDGTLLFESDARQLTASGTYEDFRIGHMDNSYASYDSLRGYFDDLYVADGRARLELGNAAMWVDCTERDIQIPSYWAADGDSITFEVNAPSFASGETAYLYVVHSGGSVSPGYAVTIDGGGAYVPPTSAPGTPTVARDGNDAIVTTTNSVPAASAYQYEMSIDGALKYVGLTDHPDTSVTLTSVAFGTGDFTTLTQAVDASGNSQSTSAKRSGYTVDTTAPTVTVANARADSNVVGSGDEVGLYFDVTADEPVYFKAGFKRTAASDTTWFAYTDTLTDAGDTVSFSIATGDTPADATSFIAFAKAKDAALNEGTPDTALVTLVRTETTAAAWAGQKIVYAMDGHTVVDTSGQDQRIYGADIEYMNIDMGDTNATDGEDENWQTTTMLWGESPLQLSQNADPFDLSTGYATGSSDYKSIYSFIAFGQLDSMANATVDTAYLGLEIGGTLVVADSICVIGAVDAAMMEWVGGGNKNSNYIYSDATGTTAWTKHPSQWSIAGLNNTYRYSFADITGIQDFDVTQQVQDAIDAGVSHLVLGLSLVNASSNNALSGLRHPTRTVDVALYLVVELAE